MQWLAWLGLLLATQVATAHDAVAAPRHDRAEASAAIRPGPPPDGSAACDADAGDRDDLIAGAILAAGFTPRPPAVRSLAARETVRRADSAVIRLRPGPRAPPFSCSFSLRQT